MITRTSRKPSPQPSSSRCNHTTSNGSRCRMLAIEESRFCRAHDKHSRQDAAALAAELSKVAGNLSSPDQVRELLAKILLALIEGRLSSRKAGVAGYLSQMLLQSQREVGADQRQAERKQLEAETKLFLGGLDLEYPERARESLNLRLGRITEHEKRVAEVEAFNKVARELANQRANKHVKKVPRAVSASAESVKSPAAVPAQPPTPAKSENTPAVSASVPPKDSTSETITRITVQTQSSAKPKSTSEKTGDIPKPAPPAPAIDFNHFYPFDPTLKPGLQNVAITNPPPDAEEQRWHELNRRFARRRR